MIDWTLSHDDSFEYIRVHNGIEMESLGNVKPGGSIAYNTNTDLKVSGSFDAVGDLGVGSDLVRIYLTATQGSESERIALATLFASTPSRTVDDMAASGTVTLYSTLLQLSEDCFEESYTVPAGSNAIALAVSIAEGAGVTVKSTPSAVEVGSNATFAAGDSKLKVVNYLLSIANYTSAQVDGYGNVVFAPYQSPATRQPVWTFVDGDRSIFLPGLTDEEDWYHTPNVIICSVENNDITMTATAVNDGTGIYNGSPYSTAARGRRICAYYSYSDIADQATLQAKADALLLTNSGKTRTITVKHAYAPIGTLDVVRMAYRAQDIDLYGTVQSMTLTLLPGVSTESKIRRVAHG